MYLHVKAGGKYWRLDYRHAARRTPALGLYPAVSLAKSRKLRGKAREQLAEGIDPSEAKRDDKRARVDAAGNSHKSVATAWLAANRTRVRELCSQMLRHAISTGSVSYNPAADLMPKVVVPQMRHRPAITDRRALGQFLRDLRDFTDVDPITKVATRLALLTFVRSRELRHARWEGIDLPANEWCIPVMRVKMDKGLSQTHIVPLPAHSIAVLDELRTLTGDINNMFPNTFGADGFMSENTMGGRCQAS